jgi:hypothetical protein
MSDFWADRGFLAPKAGTVEVSLPTDTSVPDVALPSDYAARVRAAELAVQMTMSRFDGGQERVMQRAMAFHAFLIGRPAYETALTSEAYEAAFKVAGDMDMTADNQEMVEAAIDAAWKVMFGGGSEG